MGFWKPCSGRVCSATLVSIPLTGIQGIQRNDILEILADLRDEHAALGVSWDGCGHASVLFLHLMVQRGRKEIRLNSLHHPISS